MKTTKRFDNAVRKLYTAFHKGELDVYDCNHCAVGNICDNKDEWKFIRNKGYDIGHIAPLINKKTLNVIEPFGYSPQELIIIELLFMRGTRKDREMRIFTHNDDIKERKEIQFQGLCAVIEYLCELDNIPNVMDYTSLFEYKDKIKELTI